MAKFRIPHRGREGGVVVEPTNLAPGNGCKAAWHRPIRRLSTCPGRRAAGELTRGSRRNAPGGRTCDRWGEDLHFLRTRTEHEKRSEGMLTTGLAADVENFPLAPAEATGRTLTFHACEAILEQTDDLEDLYLAEPGSDRDPCGSPLYRPLENLMRDSCMED